MKPNTIKMGIMDEERRTTVNLGMHPRREGSGRLHQHRLPRSHRRRDAHLDGSRADDPQGRHEVGSWIQAYENWNVDIGLECGLPAARRSARACGRCPT
jgi:malate synthase